ncbi:MAG: HD domain-containing protein, partial [Acetobacter sp.]|nr:HD domain-containing protein [Acetobacter sp.]
MFMSPEHVISPQYLDTIARGTLTPENFIACLHRELQEITANGTLNRESVITIFRCYWARYQEEIRNRFEHYEFKGVVAAKLIATFTDSLLRHIVETAVQFCPDTCSDTYLTILSENGGFSVVATGGYGRGLLAPFSDIDLLFLIADGMVERVSPLVESVLYFLWDLGFQVGHATRTVGECIAKAHEDTTIRTALLDARFLIGDSALFATFEAEYARSCMKVGMVEFIHDKQRERLKRHRRFGSSPYLVEPNLKEGHGGLRDLQTLYWICCNTLGVRHVRDLLASQFVAMGFLTEREAQRARRSWDFLWTVRLHLHYVTGRAEERLTFDIQPIIGARMGYVYHGRQKGVERFMRHYFLTVREVMRLTHVFEPIVLRQAQRNVIGSIAESTTGNTADRITQEGCVQSDKALREAGFTVLEGQILPADGVSFEHDPIKMLQILHWAQRCGYPLHPLARHQLIRWEHKATALRNNPEASRLFLDLLCCELPQESSCTLESPLSESHASKSSLQNVVRESQWEGDLSQPCEEKKVSLGHAYWLRILNETGIFGRLMPDWARIVGQMQFDTYHVFTVDEHTIEAIRILDEVMAGRMADEIPVVYGIVKHLPFRELYMAVLLHDVAKGRGGDHSEIGADIATKLCLQLGMTEEEAETVSWLVLHHLLLSQMAFQRDISDPKTISDVAESVQSLERLRLLLLLTVVDIRAVSGRVWNAWKATLLRDLYERVAEVLSGSALIMADDTRVHYVQRVITGTLLEEGFDQQEIERYTELFPAGYWLAFDDDALCRRARLLRESEESDSSLLVDVVPLMTKDVVEVIVYTGNVPGIFSKIVGALALADVSVIDASAYITTNNKALDTFWVQNVKGNAFCDEA